MLLFVPGMGESYVTSRARLAIGLTVSAFLYPILYELLPQQIPNSLIEIAKILIFETTIGVFFGLLLRIIQASLHIAGMKIAYMSGLSTATLFDVNQSTQGSVIGGFLTVVGITLFFTTNLHHILIIGITESFSFLRVNGDLPTEDFAFLSFTFLSDAFLIAFKISAPVIIVGLMLYLVAGLMGRLMPNMQVFFVLLPVQIFIGFLFLGLSLSTFFLVYINFFEEKLLQLFY